MRPRQHHSVWSRVTRRDLLRLLLGLATFLPASFLFAAADEASKGAFSLRALGPFLDTLLPEDDSPSATQLGIDREIVERMQGNRRMTQTIVMGCAWLDQQAAGVGAEEFAALESEKREPIVERAEQASPRSLPRAFFTGMRTMAFELYYAHPESWPTLGYIGPPQPKGFMDFAAAPPGAPE